MATKKRSKHASRATQTPADAKAASEAEAAAIAALEEQPSTTFPPSACDASLPASTAFHDVTFAEFKRLNRTIDDLPYPLVLSDFDREKYVKAGLKNARMLSTAATTLASLGGVPVSQAFAESVSELAQPLFQDVPVANVFETIASGKLTGEATGNKPVKIALSDQDKADLAAGVPVLAHVSLGKGDALLRLVPEVAAQTEPLRNAYEVGSLHDFLRNPYVESVDGGLLRVALDARQLQALKMHGTATTRIGGSDVALRLSAPPQQGSGMVFYAAVPPPPAGSTTTTTGTPPPPTSGGTVNNSTYPVPPPNTGGYVPPPPAGSSGGGRTPPPPPSSSGSGTTTPPSYPEPPAQTRLPLALYIPWRHRWILRGYSRGELLHSMALGPQEEVTLEISSWDRRRRSVDDSAQSEFEQSSDFTETSRDAQSVVREASSQTELGMTVSANVGFKVEVVNFSGGTTANARALLTNTSRNNLDILRESVSKAATKLKLQRETKVSESSEYGTEEKVTRRVRNPNLCHTLTLNYHEVLAHYEIETSFNRDEARLCVLDPNPVQAVDFTYENIRYYESVLRQVLLVPGLSPGFDAARKLFAQDQLREAKRRNELANATARLPVVNDDGRQALAAQAQRIVAAFRSLAGSTISTTATLSPWMILIPYPVWTVSIANAGSLQRYMYLRRARAIAPGLFDVLASISSDPGSAASIQALAEALGALSTASIATSAIAQDKDAMYKVLREDLGVPPMIPLVDVPDSAYAPNDAGLLAALSTFADLMRAATESEAAAAARAAMEANQAAVQTDYSDKEIAEALEAVQSLAVHLNRYRNYYRTCILTLMPFPDDFQQRLGMLPMVERRVLGFDGDQIALPVRPGADPRTDELFEQLVVENASLVSLRTSQRVTLPTSGIHVESRLGECCACEDYIDDLRDLDLQARRADIALKRASLAQQEAETERRRARMQAGDYDDPVAHTPVLRLEGLPQPATTPASVPGVPVVVPGVPTP